MSMQSPSLDLVQEQEESEMPTLEGLKAFEETKAERDALPLNQLVPVFTEVSVASRKVRAAALRAQAYGAELDALPQTPKGLPAKVAQYAYAARHANVRFKTSTEDPEEILPVSEQAKEVRAVLMADAEALVVRKLLVAKAIDDVTNGPGYQQIVEDVLILVDAIRGAGPKAESVVGSKSADLDRAYVLAEKLETLVTVRADREKAVAKAHADRERAFTLMAKAYEQLQRALDYLLHGRPEAGTIAPSMHTGGRPRRPVEDETEPVVAPEPAPVVPDPTVGTPPGGATPGGPFADG